MNPAALKSNLEDLDRHGILIVDEFAFTKKGLEQAGYESNPLEDGSLDGYQLLKVDITKLTRNAVDGLGLSQKEADRCRNFVAMGLVLWVIFGPWKRPGVASMSGTEPFAQALWFPTLEGWRVSPLALGITFGVIFATAWILRHSRFGLNLKAVGLNPSAVPLYGLSAQRYLLIAIVISGAVAGMAGMLQVSSLYHRLIPAISSGYGYLGLLVVMLANYRPALVPLIALFFAALNVGSIQLPMMMQLDSSLAGVIQGALVLSALLVFGLRKLRPRVAGNG